MTRLILLPLILVLVAVTGGAVGWLAARFDWTTPKRIVREPQTPQEARLEYTPPDPPRMPIDVLTRNPMLKSLLLPRVHSVAAGVYSATGFALGNVGVVVTGDGLVIIDTTESQEAAREILVEVRKLSAQPVKAIIYTHSHLDHVMAARTFYQEGVEIYANAKTPDFMDFQFEMLETYQLRARSFQAGTIDPQHAFPLPVERNPVRGLGNSGELMPPTRLIGERTTVVIGGSTLELIPLAGETPDHLAVWLPEQRVLFTGDLFYQSFPNLSTPMLEPRPVKSWYESIELFMTLEAHHLIPGHSDPVSGEKEVMSALNDYRDGIKYVHDEAVRRINTGISVDQAVAEITLPDRLAQSPWLQERYGRVSWSVRGIYQGYTGWYDGQGPGLNPLPPAYTARELVALAGGADKVLSRAIALQKSEEWQQAAELAELVITANPRDRLAHRVKAASMHRLAFSVNNLNNFGFFRSAYSLEMARGEAD